MFHLVTMGPCILANKSRNRVRSIIPSCSQAMNTQELYMAIPPKENYVLRLMLTLHDAISVPFLTPISLIIRKPLPEWL